MTNDEELILRYLEFNPHKSAMDEVRLKDYGVAVWALIGHLPAVNGDLAQVAESYRVPLAAVEAAYAFYRRNRAIIDARIAANNPEFNDLLHIF